MGTTADKLNKLKATKEAIRTAINNKGGTLTTSDKFSDYATAIDNIQSGGGDNLLQHVIDNQGGDGKPSCNHLFYYYKGTNLDNILNNIDISKSNNMNYMFSNCSNLISIPQLDTSNVTYMQYTFENCKKLTTIPQLDTSKVMYTHYMFSGCSSLEEIPILNTSSLTQMPFMFYRCSSLKEIPILDTSKVTDFESAFRDCKNLTSIKLDTSSFYNMQEMIRGCDKLETLDITHLSRTSTYCFNYFASDCYSLKKIIIRNIKDDVPGVSRHAEFANCYHLYGTENETYNPYGLRDGRIYVPDDKVDYVKGKWKELADIIFSLNLLGKADISNINSKSTKYIINKSSLFIIILFDFINTPEVMITSSNEQVATISDIVITTKKITFKANYLSAGVATITAQITGDKSATKTIDVNVVESIQYRVEQISGVTYGFTLNSNEYYESTNKKVDGSYSLCKLVFNATEKNKTLQLECINSGENGYDFGILSKIDIPLSLSNSEDSSANTFKSFKSQSGTTSVVVTYPEAPVGEHFIYIKYRKDGSGSNGNDSLQFKVI